MKNLKTLLLLLICFNLNAQKTELKYHDNPKVIWDIQMLGGFLKQGDNLILIAGSLQVATLFQNHLYLSTSYLDAFELPLFDFDIAPAFGSRVPAVEEKKEYLRSISISAGGHYGNRFLIIYGGIGPSYNRGFFYDVNGNNGQNFRNFGIDFKSNAVIPIKKYLGIGIQFHYNINNAKNFIDMTLGCTYSF